MSALNYNDVSALPLAAIKQAPAWQLAIFLGACRPLVRDSILAALRGKGGAK